MEEWERAFVRGRALSRLSAFIGVMSVLLLWMYLQDHSPRVMTERATATVLAVKQPGWQVRLGTGEALWIHSSPGITMQQGERIPVLIERYESGNARVQFDRERWLTGG